MLHVLAVVYAPEGRERRNSLEVRVDKLAAPSTATTNFEAAVDMAADAMLKTERSDRSIHPQERCRKRRGMSANEHLGRNPGPQAMYDDDIQDAHFHTSSFGV